MADELRGPRSEAAEPEAYRSSFADLLPGFKIGLSVHMGHEQYPSFLIQMRETAV
jgi:hypothetical protein